MNTNQSPIKIMMLSIIALIVIAAAALFFIRPMLIKKTLPAPIVIDTAEQPTLGSPTAKIHIVAFEDLKCSNCARFNREMMPHIKKEFIDKNIANYTLINLAFIEGSMPAANAARCIYKQNPALFFDFTDYIFQNQPPETENWATVPTLLNYASHIKGIDTNALAQCMIQSPYDQFIQNNLSIAKKAMGAEIATPTLFINGVRVTPLTESQIDKVIEAVK